MGSWEACWESLRHCLHGWHPLWTHHQVTGSVCVCVFAEVWHLVNCLVVCVYIQYLLTVPFLHLSVQCGSGGEHQGKGQQSLQHQHGGQIRSDCALAVYHLSFTIQHFCKQRHLLLTCYFTFIPSYTFFLCSKLLTHKITWFLNSSNSVRNP